MRVVPALGHLAVRMITNCVVDRSVQNWIVEEHSRPTAKNTIAVLVRVLEQAVRDGIIKIDPAGLRLVEALQTGRGRTLRPASPRPPRPGARSFDWATHWWPPRTTSIEAGVTSSCSALAPLPASAKSPGAAFQTGHPGQHAQKVPVIEAIRPLVAQRTLSAGPAPDALLFTGPRGGTHIDRSPARCDPLGRGGHPPRIRAPAPPRSSSHRTDLAGGRRSPPPRPAQNRRSRLPGHHPALPAPRRPQDHSRRHDTVRAPQRATRPTHASRNDCPHPITRPRPVGPQLAPNNE